MESGKIKMDFRKLNEMDESHILFLFHKSLQAHTYLHITGTLEQIISTRWGTLRQVTIFPCHRF